MTERKRSKIPESKKLVKNFTQGISCPRCGCRHWEVAESLRIGGRIERWRKCRNCPTRIRTKEEFVEIIETDSGSI